MKKNSIWSFFGVLAVLLFLTTSAMAGQVPKLINYQGSLFDKGTPPQPVPDGNYNITFSIYDVQTAGTPLWTETWSAQATPPTPVIVTGGVFNVMLGTITPLPANFFAEHPTAYLGVKVGSNSEMLPRQRLTSVGYAFTAGDGVPKGGIIMWSGAIDQVPAGWAICDGNNGTPDLRDRFVLGAGNKYAVASIGGSPTANLNHSHAVAGHSHSISSVDINHSHNDDHQHSGNTNGMNIIDSNSVDDNDSSGKTNVMDDTDHHHSFATNYKSQQGFGTTTGLMNQNNIHNHGASTGNSAPVTDTKLSETQELLPPYYALAFIMKQ